MQKFRNLKAQGRMAWRVNVFPVQEFATKQGIKNPQQLATITGLSWHTADKWWHGFQSRYIDGSILYLLCDVLSCRPDQIITGVWIDE